MATVLKYILGAFILFGIVIFFYGGREILGTMSLLKNSQERAKGIFKYYVTEEVRSHSTTTNVFGNRGIGETTSYMSYPHFEFTSKDGEKHEVTESKHHIIARLKPGQEIEVIVSPYGDHRIAGFYSLYVLDIVILALGLCFIFIPLLIGKVVISSLATPAGMEMASRMGEQFGSILSSKVGPVSVAAILKGSGIIAALMLFISLGSALTPFIEQLHLGFGWGLTEALKEERFDEARELILKGKGINKVDEYKRNPLHLALEKSRPDLARLLIEAGTDLNLKNKMILKTPLEIATHSGDLEMVKLLLSKGALPDADNDESPPVMRAIIKGHDEIACALIESGCDIKRIYVQGDIRFTVGDLAVAKKKPVLIDLIRKRGGVFTALSEKSYSNSSADGLGSR